MLFFAMIIQSELDKNQQIGNQNLLHRQTVSDIHDISNDIHVP